MRRCFLMIALLWSCLASCLAAAPLQVPTPAQDPEEPIRERTIYIPYQRLRSLFEKEGRGVFVPYETFQQLWEAARRANQPVGAEPLRRRSMIASIESQATVVGDVVNVRSVLQIELLDKGWHELPLRLMGASLRSATINNEAARVFQAEDGVRYLLLQNSTDEPMAVELVLEYSGAYQKSPGTNQVAFHPPQAPIHRWRIEVPQRGAEIKVTPEVAVRVIDPATEVSEGSDDEASATDGASATNGVADGSDTPASEDADEPDAAEGASEEPAAEQPAEPALEKTIVEAFVGGADLVGFTWTAKAEGAAGLAALVTAQSQQEMTVEEGVIRTRINVSYDISRADVSRLTLEVPADHNIVNVFDPNVQRWEKSNVEGAQLIDVTLYQPTRGAQALVIELEQFTSGREMMVAMVQADLHAATVKAVAAGNGEELVPVGRQQGIVVVKLAASLRGDVFERAGLVQIDASQLPSPLDRQPWDFAYRYASVPYDLGVRVEKLLPELSTQEFVETSVTPEAITTTNTVAIDVARAGIFQVEFEVPTGDEIVEIIGVGVPNGEPATIDSHELKPSAAEGVPSTLVVQLGRQALGRIGLRLTTKRVLSDPNLLTPTGVESELALSFPRVSTKTTLRSRGRLLVSAPGSLRLDPRRSVGVRPLVQETEGFELGRSVALGAEMSDVAELSFGRDAVDLAYGVQRRRPYVTAQQFLSVSVESGVAKFQSTFRFNVLYSGVENLRLDVPTALADELINQDDGLRERAMDPQPDNVTEGYVAWQLSGDAELLGDHAVTFEWEVALGELPVGTGVAIAIPVIKVPEADRFWGQVVGRKAETIEIGVSGTPSGVRPIDPQNDLMAGFDGAGVARAFEFQGDWSLALEATRYELEEVKRTSVERGLVRMIVTRSDQVAVQAIYRLRSARQRIAVRLPGVDPAETGESLDSQPLRINQRAVPLERDANQFYIPFTGHSADEPVVVELRYTIPRGTRLMVPEFTEDPAAQKIDLVVYLPEELVVLRQNGNWSRPNESWMGPVRGSESEQSVMNEISSGVTLISPLGSDFPVDGRPYRFSTLRPAAGDEGGLTLTTANRFRFDLAVAAFVLVVGLVLAFQPIGVRFLGLGALIVAGLSLLVVEPWGAKAVLNWPLFGTAGLVIVAWGVRGGVWSIARGAQWIDHRSVAASRDLETALAASGNASSTGSSPASTSATALAQESPGALSSSTSSTSPSASTSASDVEFKSEVVDRSATPESPAGDASDSQGKES